METTEKKWYQTKKWIWILSFLFAPIGLYQLWKSKEFAKKLKIIITCLVVVFYAIGMAMPDTPHKDSNGSNSLSEEREAYRAGYADGQNKQQNPSWPDCPTCLRQHREIQGDHDKALYTEGFSDGYDGAEEKYK